MKKIIKQIFLPLVLILLMGSCNDEPEYYTLDTPPDQMHLTASAEDLVLERVKELDEAISFSWSEAANRGANTKLTYYFRLYHAEMTNLESELIKIDEGVRSISWTVRELNNLLHSWNISPGDEVTIEAEILAVVEVSAKYMKPEISKTQFNVVGYEAFNKLYLTVANGDTKRSLDMIMVDDGVFNWKGDLDICDFWFVRDTEKGAPSYMKGDNENKLVYSVSGEGQAFNIDMYGGYDITVDLNNLTIRILPIGELYLVTSKNGVEQVTTLREIEAGTGIFFIRDEFDAGTEFRFARDEFETWPAYVKGADETKLEYKEEGSEMFKISKTAVYEMTVDLVNHSLTMVEIEKIYLITSKNGIEEFTALDEITAGSDIYYLQAEFDAGTEFRFVRGKDSTWPAYVKGADDSKLELKDQGAEMFKVGKTATYVMTVNIAELSLIFLDLEYVIPQGKAIAVVGGCTPVGWDAGAAVSNCSLTQKDLINRPEVVSYTGTFTYTPNAADKDENAFKFVGDGGWGHSLFATQSYANPFDSSQQTVTTNNQDDRKWMLPAGTESGTYTLEMNLHTMKIDLIKQ